MHKRFCEAPWGFGLSAFPVVSCSHGTQTGTLVFRRLALERIDSKRKVHNG